MCTLICTPSCAAVESPGSAHHYAIEDPFMELKLNNQCLILDEEEEEDIHYVLRELP